MENDKIISVGDQNILKEKCTVVANILYALDNAREQVSEILQRVVEICIDDHEIEVKVSLTCDDFESSSEFAEYEVELTWDNKDIDFGPVIYHDRLDLLSEQLDGCPIKIMPKGKALFLYINCAWLAHRLGGNLDEDNEE